VSAAVAAAAVVNSGSNVRHATFVIRILLRVFANVVALVNTKSISSVHSPVRAPDASRYSGESDAVSKEICSSRSINTDIHLSYVCYNLPTTACAWAIKRNWRMARLQYVLFTDVGTKLLADVR